MDAKSRLITRSDFDGLVCAVLKEMDLFEDISFLHPKDVQDGKIALTERNITNNLPYVPGVHLSFDHCGGTFRFGDRFNEVMEAVDKGDSAQFSHEEILNATDWVFLNYPMDSRTGLGRFREFRVRN